MRNVILIFEQSLNLLPPVSFVTDSQSFIIQNLRISVVLRSRNKFYMLQEKLQRIFITRVLFLSSTFVFFC